MYWLFQAIGWTIYSIGTFIIIASMASLTVAFTNMLIITGSGLLISHGLRRLYGHRIWQQPHFARSVLLYLLTLLVAAVLWESIIVGSMFVVYSWFRPADFNWLTAMYYLINYFLTLLIWTLLYQGYQTYRRQRRAEVENLKLQLALKEAQLQGLKFQMNPHFLFNALNSIRTLALDSPTETRDMVSRLSGLLRYTLNSDERNTVELGQELEIVKHYLAIEKVRFESRLAVEWEIDQTLLTTEVLPLSVQTLVENAVKHGIANRPEGGTVRIRILNHNERLVIEVANEGQLPQTVKENVGFRNTRERLALQFGQIASLTLQQRQQWVVATIQLPINESEMA